MLIPRRRITSLTILSLVVFTIWYLFHESSLTTEDVTARIKSGIKHKPDDARLAPPTPVQTEDAPEQASPIEIPSPIVSDTTIASNETGLKQEQKIESPELDEIAAKLQTQKNRWNTGQATIGTKTFVAKHPVAELQDLPLAAPLELPKLQHAFDEETDTAKKRRLERLAAVKESFVHSWAGYKKYAWLQDELIPVSQSSRNNFGGWAATLVDSLDTLWMMGLHEEFEEAVEAVKSIDFAEPKIENLNTFETTIRFLGGLLGAYDISEAKYPMLLEKAAQVGELLYCAFDTPNHMPVTRFAWKQALDGADQTAGSNSIVAELGSLDLEFTRLSQLTGDPKYYDAVTRVMREFQLSQSSTKIAGLWPTIVDAKRLTFNDNGFTLGGMADSLYEYLPKQHMLMGGRTGGLKYQDMYKFAITAAMNHIFFQPMLPEGADVLISGSAQSDGTESNDPNYKTKLTPRGQHLGCYAGGMVGIGAKLFDQPEHLNMARKLVDGCIWMYKNMPTGIMPEIFHMIPCEMNSDCTWDEAEWERQVRKKYTAHLADPDGSDVEPTTDPKMTVEEMMKELRIVPGVIEIPDRRYLLRPEAIESVFIHYRLTGETDLLESAWNMFVSIENATRTDAANSAIYDVTSKGKPEKDDYMESFWLAETLKYFYLIFSDPDVVSLDKYVL